MTKLDGNALAGRLGDVLGWDASAADVRCVHCGAHDVIARAVVYATAMGTVARCGGCNGVLAVFVDGDGRAWFGLPGISAMETTH